MSEECEPTVEQIGEWVSEHQPIQWPEGVFWMAIAHIKSEALREYAENRYLAYLKDPELPWQEQPKGMARDYAMRAADLIQEADRLKAEGEAKPEREPCHCADYGVRHTYGCTGWADGDE